jgi:transcriptional regulator with GAF, ATPase, and Fis domain
VAVHKAIKAGTLEALKIGNVTVVNRESAVAYRKRRQRTGSPTGSDETEARDSVEIQKALALAKGNKAKAAKLLGLAERAPHAGRAKVAGAAPKPKQARGTAE